MSKRSKFFNDEDRKTDDVREDEYLIDRNKEKDRRNKRLNIASERDKPWVKRNKRWDDDEN